jgi:hypothetical protein
MKVCIDHPAQALECSSYSIEVASFLPPKKENKLIPYSSKRILKRIKNIRKE